MGLNQDYDDEVGPSLIESMPARSSPRQRAYRPASRIPTPGASRPRPSLEFQGLYTDDDGRDDGRDDSRDESSDESGDEATTDNDSIGSTPDRSTIDDFDVPDVDDVDIVTEEIFRLLMGDCGCRPEQHEDDSISHMADGLDNHCDLSATYLDERGRQRLGSHPRVGLRHDGFPSNEGHARHVYLAASTLRSLFEGRLDEETPMPQVCLHSEETPRAGAKISFDVDSFLGFPSSLGALRKGFRFCPSHNLSRGIRSSLHIKRRVLYSGPKGKLTQRTHHFRDIPHMYLGSIDGLFDCSLYIFFPRLMSTIDHRGRGEPRKKKRKRFTYLPAATVQRFVDQALLPCVRKYVEEDCLQRVPPSQQVGELKAQAKGIEHQQRVGERGLKVSFTHHIPSDGLEQVWTEMNRMFDDPRFRLTEFQDAFLLINAKGFKSDFKVTGSLYQAIDRYLTHLEGIFDFELMQHMVHDIAREVYPLSPIRHPFVSTQSDEKAVLFWKTCCLRSEHARLRDGCFGGQSGQMCLYHPCFLRDTANMTVEPPVRSPAYRGGWYYGQWYSASKEISDAGSLHTFTNEGLTELAIDARVWAAHAKRQGNGDLRRREFLLRSFVGCKRRTYDSYSDYAKVAFATRWEGRTAHAVLLRLREMARLREEEGGLDIILDETPSAAWAIRADSWCRFILNNYDKYITAVEVASVTSPNTGISFERSKCMAALLKCIARLSSCDPSRDALLSYSVRQSRDGQVQGLGIQDAIAEHGYGWLRPIIDWEALTFKVDVSSEVVRGDRNLSRWYARSGQLLQDTDNSLQLCFAALQDPSSVYAARYEALLLVAHLCLREYRRDIVKAIKKEFLQPEDDDFDTDNIRFSYDGLSNTLIDQPKLIWSNKTGIKTPEDLFQWIWGVHEGRKRKYFQQKPFRIMQDKVHDALAAGRPGLLEQWTNLLKLEFFRHHWVVPYPDTNGTFIATAKTTGARQWWSVMTDGTHAGTSWGRRDRMRGSPPDYPATLDMGTDDLKAFFSGLSSERHRDGTIP